MRSTFPLFSTPIDLAHDYWKKLVTPNDFVIDMTCGNGHDTLFLKSLNPKKIVALDIQQAALDASKEKMPEGVEFLLQSHADYPDHLDDNSVKLAIYNLGWLPGSDKSCTTEVSSTLNSVAKLLPKMVKGGAISITCYPGHPEGAREEEALLTFCKSLSPHQWNVCHHRWINRNASPSLILLQLQEERLA